MGEMRLSLAAPMCMGLLICLCGSTYATMSPLEVSLFASSTCEECRAVKAELLPRVEAQYGGEIAFRFVPVDDVEAFKLQLLYEKRYGVVNDEALKVFVGTQCLSGKQAIIENLERVIAEELAKGSVTPTPEEVLKADKNAQTSSAEAGGGASGAAGERFARFRPATVALAGLIDGVNPCAFTTIIFFVSLLASLGKGRRDVLTVGLCFAGAVFVTYMALGFGMFKAIKVASVNAGVARCLTLGVAALTLVFGGYSLLDWHRYRRSGKSEDIKLKLPDRIRNRVRTMISRQMRTRNLVLGALILGIVVSLLEAMCTGQVYLPTIMVVSRDPQMAAKAASYLVLYNGMFITPLLGVFGVALWGVSSERMAAFSRKHVGTTKLLLGLLFVGLAVLLIASVV